MQELLYTSHQGAGLRKGTGGGFCTVLSTEGMAANLAMALEKLSGYRHPFDIHDPRSQSNPTNYRHAVLRIGGISYHVLSRVADHRFEHTGRSNKLAFHIALAKNELPACGPAELCQLTGFLRSEWDGQVRLESARAPISVPVVKNPGPCRAWQKAAGDAGWAGVVAEHVLSSPNVPISIVFPLETDTLGLIKDVFSLIPPSKRWDYTFSTFFTTLTAGTSCNIRCLLGGTPEADKLLRDKREKIIDLTNPLAQAPPSQLVVAARTGSTVHAEPDKPSVRRPSPKSLAAAEEPIDVTMDDLFEDDPFVDSPQDGRSGPGIGPPIPPKPTRRGGAATAPTRQRASKGPKSPRSDSNRGLKVAGMAMAAIAAFGVVIMVVGAGAFFLGALWNPATQVADNGTASPNSSGMTAGPSPTQLSPPATAPNLPIPNGPPVEVKPAEVEPSSDDNSSKEPKTASEDHPDRPKPPKESKPATETTDSANGSPNGKTKDGMENELNRETESAPPVEEPSAPKPFTVPDVLPLPEYEGKTIDPVVLLEAPLGSTIENLKFGFVQQISDNTVALKGLPRSGKVNISSDGFPTVANFILQDNKLLFQWNALVGSENSLRLLGNGLRWCEVGFEVGGKPYTCRLSNARTHPAVNFQPLPNARIGMFVADLTSLLDSRTPKVESLEIQGTPKLINDAVFGPFEKQNQSFVATATVPIKDAAGAVQQIPVIQMRLRMKAEPNGNLRLEAELDTRSVLDLLNFDRLAGTPSWEPPSPTSLADALEELPQKLAEFKETAIRIQKELEDKQKKFNKEQNPTLGLEISALEVNKKRFQFAESHVEKLIPLFQHLEEIISGKRSIRMSDFRLQLHFDRLGSFDGETSPAVTDLLVVGNPIQPSPSANEIGTPNAQPKANGPLVPQATVGSPQQASPPPPPK